MCLSFQVFKSLNLNPHDLSVDQLDVHAVSPYVSVLLSFYSVSTFFSLSKVCIAEINTQSLTKHLSNGNKNKTF